MELQGKKIAFLGDSITEGCGVENLVNRYDNRLKEMCGLAAVYNYGIGGTRIACNTHASEKPRYDLYFSARAYDMEKDVDLVVVFGGTNDYGHGDAPFGTSEDVTPDTYLGGVRFLMKLLREIYQNTPIVFLTPARRNGDEAIYFRQTTNPHARSLIHYVDGIQLIAKDFEIPVLDLYHELGIDPNLAEHREKYAPDGLHFNDAGHAKLAAVLRDFLLAL